MKREEAIERIKIRFDKWALDNGDMKAIQTLVPELCESEDERIRKAIIKALYSHTNSINVLSSEGYSMDDVLAWVEKQKEQKPAEWNEDWREEDIQTRFAFYTYKDDPSVLYLSNVFVEEASRNHGFGTRILIAAEKVAETIGATTISLKVKQDSPANAWYRKNGYGYVAFEDGYDWLEKNLEYMKPIKSAEWSEEDKNVIETLIRELRLNAQFEIAVRKLGLDYIQTLTVLDKCRRLCPQPKQEWSDEDKIRMESCMLYLANTRDTIEFNQYIGDNARKSGKKEIQKDIDWLKNLSERIDLQSKQNWSEEDEEILNTIIADVNRTLHSCGIGTDEWNIRSKAIRWLRSFHPQSKEESCNYITPNKEFFQWIYDRLVYVHKENPDVDYMRSFKERINNLSFEDKCYWKPSEEQMEAMKKSLAYWRGITKEIPSSKLLESLYNDLKKLI